MGSWIARSRRAAIWKFSCALFILYVAGKNAADCKAAGCFVWSRSFFRQFASCISVPDDTANVVRTRWGILCRKKKEEIVCLIARMQVVCMSPPTLANMQLDCLPRLWLKCHPQVAVCLFNFCLCMLWFCKAGGGALPTETAEVAFWQILETLNMDFFQNLMWACRLRARLLCHRSSQRSPEMYCRSKCLQMWQWQVQKNLLSWNQKKKCWWLKQCTCKMLTTKQRR